MGAVQDKQGANAASDTTQVDISQTRFLRDGESSKIHRGGTEIFCIPMFKRLVGWELELQGIVGQETMEGNVMVSTVYFQSKQDLQIYLGALLGLRQICEMNIFDDIEIKLEKIPLEITIKQTLSDAPRQLDRKDLSGNINKFIDLLIFLAQMIIKTNNLYIEPQDIAEVNGSFHLRGFLCKNYAKKKLILTYIAWLYEEFDNFEDGIVSENILTAFSELDIYLKEIYYTIKNQKIKDEELVVYLRKVKEKVKYLAGNFDSFHACFKAKRVKYSNPSTKEWILAKKSNQIYFFNIEDEHVCHGRIIRKKKKINIENAHMIFNSEDYEANFMLQGTKNLVRTSQFELEDSFTISDIEIKYKFPFKMRNPMMFLRGRQLYLFDQMVFRYVIDENKLYQQSKKINDCLFLVPSIQNNYLIIRLSIDIFRHGIRIYIGDRYETLYPSGNPAMAADIEHIKIDVKHVEFCFEVYKGVYLMLASKNLWILDINFMCFFSYASIERVKDYCKGRASSHDESDFIFQILNQPFSAHWLTHQHGINIAVKEDIMHVIASVMGKLFYIQYRFIFEAGMLRLLKYRPLFHEEKMTKTMGQIANSGFKESYFNVYNENLEFYKTNQWLYKGPVFLEVKNIRIVTCKAFSQIFVESEETLGSLKDLIEENKRKQKRWGKFETTMLLYRIFMIYDALCRNGIAHKNFNLNNLWISCSRQVKLSGWSEPPRNWHISDYKDFLLVCFNIATQNNYQKLTDKLMQKHESELQEFPFLAEKMQIGLRAKLTQKKGQLQKQIIHLKQSLHKQIYKVIQNFKSSTVIFSFEYNTPRFSALQLGEAKIKKMNAVIEGTTNHEEFTFKSSDYYAWDEQQNSLYILTTNYQMFEAKINVFDFKEETIVLEEYEYLPQNIVDCSFIYTVRGLFAFGGIARHSKKKVVFNRSVYHFNREKLTWVAVAELDEPRINPQLIVSESGSRVFVMAGELGLGSEYLQALEFDISSFRVERIVDLGLRNPLKKLGDRHSMCIYQISEQYHIFLIWSVSTTSYSFKVFSSMICGFEIDLQGKIYLEENGELPPVSMSYLDGSVHFLRPYGKYTKIALNCFETPSVTNKTLYSN